MHAPQLMRGAPPLAGSPGWLRSGEGAQEWEIPPGGPGSLDARAASEDQLVGAAISRGQTGDNTLTDLVFFRRYPRRGGRRLRRGESNFEALLREWLTLRDRLVRPALGREGAGGHRALTSGGTHDH